ncbi:MAG TPA: M48 family metallopeptidase [Burkholderiaceae bacterium]|nr:M48 family metallopeptidase [Burkholderiaceae bacterium]
MATGFFEQQEAARRTSRRLIWLFAAAVIAIVVAVNVVLGALYLQVSAPHGAWARYGLDALPLHFVPATTIVVVLMIAAGTTLQILELREGGEAVARMVGARPVDPSSRDQLERRLLNVVEEMALASGIAAPRVYVLERQDTINAFAAGLQPRDAVITVTHGALTRLTRDELQGVIGHEFSHILNGDMTLNVQLIGLLQGLLMLALFGRFLANLDSPRFSSGSRERDTRSVLFVAGIAILALGYIGVFFGRLIKAGVSRQRECLADASSVQFTRNPDGIGGALRKIGGLGAGVGAGGQIDHPHAETLSHMFMAPVRLNFASGWLATHPPLEERIQHIYGRPMDFLPAPELVVWTGHEKEQPTPELAPLPFATGQGAAPAAALAGSPAPSPAAEAVSPVTGLVGAAATGMPAAIGRPQPASRPFVEQLLERVEALGLRPALSDTTGAQLLVLGLLIDQEQTIAARQEQSVVEAFGPNAAAQVEAVRDAAARMPAGWRLPLVDLAMPALRKLPPAARGRLFALARTLIAADGRVTLPEFLLYTVLEARLGSGAQQPARPPRYASLRDLLPEARLVLSLIAAVRMPEAPAHAYDAGAGLLEGIDPQPVGRDAIALDQVSAAFHRLNGLAPLAKPQLIKACMAAAFVDGSTNWKAASCLRTLCAALDCPLPPQVDSDAQAQDAP